MFEGVDTVVLQNELAFHDELPVAWEPASGTPGPELLASLDEANITLLKACVAVEEDPAGDKQEDLIPLANELARLDHKMNLVLQLLGRLLPPDHAAKSVRLRFNALGVSWHASGALPRVGERGIVRIRLRSALPEQLQFAVSIAALSGNEVEAQHLALSERCAELIHRYCFLKHRKAVAGARKSRGV
jgi:hypothetical protein